MRRLRTHSTLRSVANLWRLGTALVAVLAWTAAPAAAQAPVSVTTSVRSATYDETHAWTITKTGGSESGFAGDILSGGTWVINVSETAASTNATVLGSIEVANLTDAQVDVIVSGALSDGTVAAVNCGSGAAVSLGPFRSETCFYLVVPPTAAAVAMVGSASVVGGPSVDGSAAVNFARNSVSGGTARLTDVVMGSVVVDEVLVAGQGPWSRSVMDPEGYSCSTYRSEYGNGYELFSNNDNEAVLAVGSDTLVATAAITYHCQAFFADVFKTTDGVVNTTLSWNFPFFMGPDGYTASYSNLIGGVQTDIDPDGDGLLPLGTALSPNNTMTVCEANLPAGYSSLWTTNGQQLIPYNPDANLDPPEDVGNRCVDFGAGTAIAVNAGATVKFSVDNRALGGDPRSPGYWKNWTRCSRVNGGQARNADRQAVRAGFAAGEGWRVGYWLLEDVLNPSIGGGIVWDDILADGIQVPIDSCEEGVEILDQRVVTINGEVGDGKKLANDGARKLAMHLLAAQLNFGAGACSTQPVLDAAIAAEQLLDQINFDGTRKSAYLTSKSGPMYAEALRLKDILALYNMGGFCGSLR